MTIPEPIKALFRSRKVLLAALGVLNTVASAYFNVKPEVWVSVDGLLSVLIYSIATEDAALKSAPVVVQSVDKAQQP